MKIQTFLNGKGLIYGRDPKRIDCDRDGILKVGDTEINVSQGGDSLMPLLFYGATQQSRQASPPRFQMSLETEHARERR